MLRARMGIRAHPTLTNGKTSKGQIGTQFGRLDRDEVHGRSLDGLGDGLGIAVVVLVALEERLDVLGRDQADVMAEWLDLAGYVTRARPGLQANKAGREIDKPADELASGYLEAHGDRAELIKADEVERVLA